MIVITAGAKQLTKELVDAHIQKGQQVRLLLNSKEELKDFQESLVVDKVDFVVGSILDVSCLEDVLEGANTVIHLNEIISFLPADKNKMYQHNVEGTANIVNVALFKKVEKLIFLSSVLALGDKSENEVFDESAKWTDVKNAKGYGWSKHLAEREIWRGVNEGLDAVILNAGYFIADNNIDENLSLMLKYLLKNKEYSNGNFSALFSSDFTRIIESVIGSECKNEQFVVAGESISFQDLLKKIRSKESNKKNLQPVSYSTLKQRSNYKRLGSVFSKNKYGIPSQHYAKLLADKRQFSNKKIKTLLAYEFLDVTSTICKLVNN